MSTDGNLERLLSETESTMSQVLRSLASGEPDALALGELRLMELVDTLSKVENFARRKPSQPIRGSLIALREMLRQGRELSALALRTVERQMESRDLFPLVPSATLCVEG